MFDASIPGQSLTKEPGNSPWEQPPLYSKEGDVMKFYLKKFKDPEFMDDLMFLLERKVPIETFVDTLTSAGVMEGYHTFDVKMLVAPQLHEYIKSLAEATDTKYVEFAGPSSEEKTKKKDKDRLLLLIEETLEEDSPEEEVLETESPDSLMTETETPPAPAPEAAPLIPRRM